MRDIKTIIIKQRNLRESVEKRKKKNKFDEIEVVKLVRKLEMESTHFGSNERWMRSFPIQTCFD